MTPKISVLHLTAHLGGGVGKALSGLVVNTPEESGIHHSIACLETPDKTQFLEQLSDSGCPVTVAPDRSALAELIEAADIVQLEWWGHPASIAALCGGSLPAMRLLVWCHVSGIHTPIIPARLIESSHRCVFTSPCSYEAAEVIQLIPTIKNKMDVIHSAGGFDGFEMPERRWDDPIVAGYLGSLNFAKLHPRYVEFLAAVDVPDFSVRMIGDITNRDILERQCREVSRPDMLEFRGYTTYAASELAAINVFPYLLNPQHYGTTENALLEAMAMGVVPIVLNNPAERYLVTDRKTGLIVRNRQEFADAVNWLARNPEERLKMGKQAASSVRERFAVGKMTEAFNHHYSAVSTADKAEISFNTILGKTPAEWFLVSQRYPEFFSGNGGKLTIDDLTLPGLLERTKGSVFHYNKYFPEDRRLAQWAKELET